MWPTKKVGVVVPFYKKQNAEDLEEIGPPRFVDPAWSITLCTALTASFLDDCNELILAPFFW